MKTVLKTLCLAVCTLLLAATCNPEAPEKEPEIIEGVIELCYTYPIESTTNSHFQIGDSIHSFSQINGMYCPVSYDRNIFAISLLDSLDPYRFVNFEMLTEKMEPEFFFQRGVLQLDTTIAKIPLMLGGEYLVKRYTTRSVFTWDTVFYENGKFCGKGSLEIMETLYTDHPDIYYPPQKIEFEFK